MSSFLDKTRPSDSWNIFRFVQFFMGCSSNTRMLGCLVACGFLALTATARAQQQNPDGVGQISESRVLDGISLDYSPRAYHWNGYKKNNNSTNLTGFEWHSPSDAFYLGACYFKNSFDQNCGYFYVGKEWFLRDLSKTPGGDRKHGLFFKITAGPLIGYSGKHKNSVPLNYHSLGWAAIPLVGYKYERLSVQTGFFSDAGVLVILGFDLFK